ncbi:MAG: cellulase family glycosylhydrolase [Terracidiphilus sp.]|jgi:aryl-phospho-beta-D-glucosidase BglC (GH1 family)
MRFLPRFFLLLFVIPSLGSGQDATQSQDRSADVQKAYARARHLKRGINVSHWFSQHAPDYSANHLDSETTDDDLALIAKMGFDNVRLSVDATPLEAALSTPLGHNSEFMSRLDHAVDTILADGLAVQIDLHPEEPYKYQLRISDEAVDRLAGLWRMLAAHYANRDPERVFFEIMNEPEETDPYRWAGIQARVAAAIRESAPKYTIIATGGNWSDIRDLLAQHPLPDGNVIYNFHFYDPHEFTHQGASWGPNWWIYEHGIPYPPTESSMKELIAQIPDAVGRYQVELYWLDHWDAHRIQLLIDEAAAWGQANHVPLICNEFGVYRRVADPVSRNAWIHDVRTALETGGIGWAMWDYHHEFGVAIEEDGRPDRPDPSTVEALGLTK